LQSRGTAVPELAERRLLLLLGAAFFIGHYDMTVLGLALPDVQASFNIPEQELGQVIAAARLGALPAIFLAMLADRIGRRALLMFTLLALSIATAATGFARNVEEFIAIQFCARALATAEEIIAVIYLLEMIPANRRGWGVGMLMAMGGMGAGAAALFYALVDVLPGGWRALYVVGTLPVLYIAWLRRTLPESTLFDQHRLHAAPQRVWQPFLEIVRNHRGDMLAIALIAVCFWFQLSPMLHFMSKYLQQTRGFAPQDVSLLYLVAGAVALLGNTLSGRLSDHIGRRPTLLAGMLLHCIATFAFYNLSGWLLTLAWIAALFSVFAVEVMIGAISGELFPTACRSTASTLRSVCATLAAVTGLAVEGSLYVSLGSHAAAISVMCLSSLVAIPVVLLMLRETSATPLQ
jgi:predicted MFS family arabinose efflux permease